MFRKNNKIHNFNKKVKIIQNKRNTQKSEVEIDKNRNSDKKSIENKAYKTI